MNDEHKSNLKKALMSQTWNKKLMLAVVDAIEDDLKKPKTKESSSDLKTALNKEKGLKSLTENKSCTEEE